MAALHGVELPEGLDGAPAECEVEDIAVLEHPNAAPEVEGSAKENGPLERPMEVVVAGAQLAVAFLVVRVKTRGPEQKRGW